MNPRSPGPGAIQAIQGLRHQRRARVRPQVWTRDAITGVTGREQAPIEAVPEHVRELLGAVLRRDVYDGTQRSRAPDATNNGDVRFGNVVVVDYQIELVAEVS